MTDLTRHQVHPADEHRHANGPEPLWNESYYLDFVAEDGALAGYARVGLYPNLGVTWWTAMIVGIDRPLAASVAYDLPVIPGAGLTLTSGEVDVRLGVDQALAEMSLHASAPAVLHGAAADVYRGEPGRPVTFGLDLVWSTEGTPYHYDLTTRYEVPCVVAGDVAVGSERIAVSGHGQRDHSWGVRDWWAFGWCWTAARLDDGTRVHAADIRIPGQPVAFGYVQGPGRSIDVVTDLEITEVPDEEGMPRRAQARIEPGGLELSIEPLAYGPLLLVAPDGRTSRFPRAAARFLARDGRVGTGWIEWNQPDPVGTGR
jgi:hypothetical protein